MEILFDPTTSCSKEHLKVYQQWFAFADSNGDGRISGNDATMFFDLSKSSRSDLQKVWAFSDVKREGYLGFKQFVAAMQLISLAQAGIELKDDILSCSDIEAIQLPVMEGLELLIAQKNSLTVVEPELNGKPQSASSSKWFGSNASGKVHFTEATSIIDGLKILYKEKLKPLETAYKFHDIVNSPLEDSDFDAKPMVMLLGQYSTGKTTFIQHLLKCDYSGAHIGPEPTTDQFVCVMSGHDTRTIPGNTIVVQADMPFSGLSNFGGTFLSKFQCSQMPHPLLEHITLVDTPGVLSGEKQKTQRSYDVPTVISWFAAKCDLILLFFDPHKLDISDEFKRVILSLRGHDGKIRIVLNKADQVNTQQLMRVYGALTWSLAKILKTPEVTRVYIGSFNNNPVNEETVGHMERELFEKEQNDILTDLKALPKKACETKINEFVKRARAAKIHAYLIDHLKHEMPLIIGKGHAQQRLIENLDREFAKVEREGRFPAGDLPSVDQFKEFLKRININDFGKLKVKLIQDVDDMINRDIPQLIQMFKNPYE